MFFIAVCLDEYISTFSILRSDKNLRIALFVPSKFNFERTYLIEHNFYLQIIANISLGRI